MYTGGMMIMLHVAIALLSLMIGTYVCWRPSERIMKLNYGLIAATTGSGVWLMVTDASQVLHVCVMGLSYLAVASALSLVARRRWLQLAQI